MPINVKVNLNGLNGRFSNERLFKARKAATNDAHQFMDKYVPKLSGNLRKFSKVAEDGHTVVYTMPYARAQFYGYIGQSEIKHYTTPGTSKRWDLRMAGNSEDMRRVKEAFVNELKRHD